MKGKWHECWKGQVSVSRFISLLPSLWYVHTQSYVLMDADGKYSYNTSLSKGDIDNGAYVCSVWQYIWGLTPNVWKETWLTDHPLKKMFMEKQLGLRLGCLFHVITFTFTFNTNNNTSRICISETDIYYIYWAWGIIRADFYQTTHCPLELNAGYISKNLTCRMNPWHIHQQSMTVINSIDILLWFQTQFWNFQRHLICNSWRDYLYSGCSKTSLLISCSFIEREWIITQPWNLTQGLNMQSFSHLNQCFKTSSFTICSDFRYLAKN